MKLYWNIKSTFFLAVFILGFQFFSFGQIYQGLSVLECNTLIIDNDNNPNFVILDVRTSGEYTPQHLEGAIQRNYYDANFEDQLNALDKSKKYLIHCQSGNRSGITLGIMENLNFEEVYDMLGGMGQWNNQNLPTTSTFAPRIMFVTESDFPNQTVNIGETETTNITLTNRANDVLSFNSTSSITNPEFTHNFDLSTTLTGSEDYTFQIIYTPTDQSTDALSFEIESNDGTVYVNVERTGTSVVKTNSINNIDVKVFPNPTSDYIQVEVGTISDVSISILSIDGKVLYSKFTNINEKINISHFEKGIYLLRVETEEKYSWTKIVIE